jgi:hypothetical protein
MTKKTKLNKTQRSLIVEYGEKHIQSSIDRTEEAKLYDILLEGANQAIRARYPESDVAILRKYKVTRQDICFRFHFPSDRVDGFYFNYDSPIADMPNEGGCRSSEVFAVPAEIEKAFDEHAKVKEDNKKLENEKLRSFRAFLTACMYLEEVLEVIELPEALRERLGHRSTGLVAVTPETVASLKATFKQAA